MSSPLPLSRFEGCLLGLATGDALGAPFEGMPADHVFWVHGPISEWLDAPDLDILRTTDDTQMALAVAEELIEHGVLDPGSLARRFADSYDPERGYGPGARRILEGVRAGGDWSQLAAEVFPGGSFGNGAAMRVAPVGLMFAHDHERLIEQARLSAMPTHQHPLGVEGAQLLALAVALAAEGPPLDRRHFLGVLDAHCTSEEFRWQIRAMRKLRRGHSIGFLGSSLPAHRSVGTAIACFLSSPDSYEGVILKAITLGDDTDTVAAMAGAISGAHLGVAAIPTRWIERLEDPAHVLAVAERLHTRSARPA
jgi:poly(ADP-ribose) glycohydrolase ARH3